MALQTHIKRRNGATYYARLVVPLDLQEQLGRKEMAKSLGTTDPREAKRIAPAVIEGWRREFDTLRARRDATEADFAAATWDHYSTLLERDLNERALPIETSTRKFLADSRQYQIAALRDHLGKGQTILVEWAADAFIAKHQLLIERGSPSYRQLCFRLMRAQIEAAERATERDRGNYAGRPLDEVVAPPSPSQLPTGTGPSIMELFGKYEAENPNAIRPETMIQSRRDVQHFADFVGPLVHGEAIERKHVREWKELVADWPIKATETKDFSGLSVTEIVAANKASAEPRPVISRNTVRRYLSSLGGFCRWLVAHDYLDANPVADLLPKKGAPATKRSTFSDEQLKTLFSAPLFRTSRGDGWRDLDHAGNVAVRDHRYWIPWIMLYSGARPAEIAQLNVGDVKQLHGVWIMHVTTEGDGNKRTKTKGSMRVVPIHRALIELGFVKHVQAMAKRGERQVFPEIVIPKTGQIAPQFSREFNRYLERLGIKSGRDLVVYSLRHTFIDRARLAGFMDEEIGTVVGHDKPTMTGRYGIEQEGTLRRRQEIVEAVIYPRL